MDSTLTQLYSRYGGYWRFPDMLDFCYLVNPYFAGSGIIEEMQASFRTLVTQYPSGMAVNSLLSSECWGIKPEYIVPGNGAAELIKALMENTDGKVGIVRPTFEEYPNRLSDDQTVVFIPEDSEFRYTEGDLIHFFDSNRADTLLLINPDNPSGNFISVDGIYRLAKWTREKGMSFILDESFVDFSAGYEKNTCLDNVFLEANPHMAVVKSISKSYGVPGLRLGILCSSDMQMVSILKKQVSIWNINSFAEYFMQIFPKYRNEYKNACDRFIQTRLEFEQELKSIPYLRVMPSQANFFFVEVLPPYNPTQLCTLLLEKYNILCSACLAKRGIEKNRYMRIAIRNNEDNRRLVQALKELII